MPATHVLVGGVIGAAAGTVTGLPLTLLLAAGMIGGILPDLDILYGHRRLLHYPVLYGVAAGTAAAAAVVWSPTAVVLLVAVLSAWTHSVMDILAGAELRSWDRSQWRETVVYDHVRQTWLRPRRVAYGGSFPDFVITLGTAIILFWTLPAPFHPVVAGTLLIGVLHTILLKPVSYAVPDDYPTWASFFQTLVFGAPQDTAGNKRVEKAV